MISRRHTAPSLTGVWRRVIGGAAAIEALELSFDVSTVLAAAVGRMQELILQATASIVLTEQGI
jgi:hypothetical protein